MTKALFSATLVCVALSLLVQIPAAGIEPGIGAALAATGLVLAGITYRRIKTGA